MCSIKKVVVVGSINADIIIEIDRLPQLGETVGARSNNTGFMCPGGKGANQAAASGKLGQQTSFIGQFGNDAYVQKLKQALTSNNVDFSCSASVDCPSGQAFVLVNSSGENSIIIVGGANEEWPEVLPDKIKNEIQNAAAILLQREIPDRVNLAVAETAFRANIPVYMDTGGKDVAWDDNLYPYLHCICPNETELSRMTGMPTETVEEAVAAAQHLLHQTGVNQVIVTLGKQGAFLVTESEYFFQPSFPVNPALIIDSTGAGDCFRAAFVVQFLAEPNIAKALQFASAASALCIQKKGAMPSMPSADMVEAFLGTTLSDIRKDSTH